jgi:hypothetical protein
MTRNELEEYLRSVISGDVSLTYSITDLRDLNIIADSPDEFTSSPWSHKDGRHYAVFMGDRFMVGHWIFRTMPGCPWIMNVSDAYVAHNLRGLGVGTALNSHRIWLMRNSVKLLMATVASNNEPQTKIMHRNKWRAVETIKISDNYNVDIYIKHMKGDNSE